MPVLTTHKELLWSKIFNSINFLHCNKYILLRLPSLYLKRYSMSDFKQTMPSYSGRKIRIYRCELNMVHNSKKFTQLKFTCNMFNITSKYKSSTFFIVCTKKAHWHYRYVITGLFFPITLWRLGEGMFSDPPPVVSFE